LKDLLRPGGGYWTICDDGKEGSTYGPLYRRRSTFTWEGTVFAWKQNLHKECQDIDRNLQIKETKYVSINAVIFFQNRDICYGMHFF
jgi:hypothetical protein